LDPITAAVIWLVVWFVVREAAAVVAFLFFALVGGAIAEGTGAVWPAGVGLILGWLTAIGVTIFSIVQVILEIIKVVQLVSA
jgi:hypothetical protein